MRQESVWTIQDLGLFLGAILPSFLIAATLTHWIGNLTVRDLTLQTVIYSLLLGALTALARGRHHRTLQIAANWTLAFRGAWVCVLASPVLALLSIVLLDLWRAPLIPSAFEQLSLGVPLPIVSVFAVVLGPMFEELVFRGFLQPLLQNRWGSRLGLLVTAFAFSLLHGAQNEWYWQYLVVLFLVGAAFGVARHITGSTAASFMLHMGFNLTQLTLAIAKRG